MTVSGGKRGEYGEVDTYGNRVGAAPGNIVIR